MRLNTWLLFLVLINPYGDGVDHTQQLKPMDQDGYDTKEQCVAEATRIAEELIKAYPNDKQKMRLLCHNPDKVA